MQHLSDLIESLAMLLIRPHRAQYSEDDLIGGKGKKFRMKGKLCTRADFTLPNAKGDNLKSSLFYQGEALDEVKGKNAVVYLHGNCGCRLDANDVVRLLVPEDIAVCCLDFSGSGLSGGEFITLGVQEPRDLKVIVLFLRSLGLVQLGLWGRSMGAVTALRYLDKERDLSIAGALVDSPFTTLVDLIHELTRQKRIPKLATNIVLHYISKVVQRKAGFDIREVNTIQSAQECWVPALLAHGEDDSMIPADHSKQVLENYSGDCQLMLFKGDHNDLRPVHVQQAARWFFRELLKGGLKEPDNLFGGLNH